MDNANLERLIAESMARFNAMTPEEQAAVRQAQRESWVRGEMALGPENGEDKPDRRPRQGRRL